MASGPTTSWEIDGETVEAVSKGVFSRVYGHVKAVDDVSLEVYEGETLGLVGESGCGKTTLGRSILRLAEPTGGKVWFDGIEVTALKGQDLRDFRKQAQIVFQDPYSSLNPRITIGEAIAEPMLVHNIEKDKKKCREEGERSGFVKGEAEKSESIALNMLKSNYSPEEISRMTGLDIPRILQLAKENNLEKP